MPGRLGLVLLVALLPDALGPTPGPPGSVGSAGAATLEIIRVSSAFDSVDTKSATAVCPAGKTVVGGGGFLRTAQATDDIVLQASYPSAADTWTAKAFEIKPVSMNWAVVAQAICARVHP